MKKSIFKTVVMATVGLAFGLTGILSASAATPKKGGILNFVVGSKIPSYDGHIESTFGMIHPIRPFYSLLFRVNTDNPADPTDFLCDVCEGKVDPAGEDGGKKFTFKIQRGIQFHDGTPMTCLLYTSDAADE